MFEVNSIKEKSFGKSKPIAKTINLWKNLDLFISASSKNSAFLDYVFNKILDFSINRISKNNTYKDFSNTLELVNSVLKAWYRDSDDKISMIIWILNKNEFLFSNIWNSSCYLIKENNVIEITDSKDKKKEFLYISNWTLENWDIISMSNRRLLAYLSESDFIDSYNENIEKFNKNIKQIFEEEKIEKNISILSFIYKINKNKENKQIDKIKDIALKVWDTSFVKRIIALYMIAKEKFLQKEKIIKNIWFLIIIIISIFFLYKIINHTVSTTNNSKNIILEKKQLKEAQIYVRKASENATNKDLFELNISNAKKIINKLEKKHLFLNDIKNLKEKISNLKKSFEWIESFKENKNNKIIDFKAEDSIKIIWLNRKTYIIWKNYIAGPIIKNVKYKKFVDKQLINDEFIDATTIAWKIALITKKWQIILFSTDWNFISSKVLWQNSWENSDIVSSYWSNIYLISKKDNQIYKHKKIWNNFNKAIAYLRKQDQKSINNMVDITIDWGFYIIQKDLKIRKFFSAPRKRLEKLILNNFPDNYKLENNNSKLKIKTRPELNYVYILLNNKIFITKPNSTRFQDTKSLKYLWQIEWTQNKIIDFYIKYDWELFVLTKTWIYKIDFEENEGKILIK